MSASNSVLKAAERQLDLNPSGIVAAQGIANATKFGAQHGDNHMSPSHLDFVHGKYYLADSLVCAAVENWIAHVCPALSLHCCITAAKLALTNGAPLAELTCRHCNHPHLDEKSHASNPHWLHHCV